MSLDYILRQFDALGPLDAKATVVIDQKFLGEAGIVAVLRAALGVSGFELLVWSAQTVRSATELKLSGTLNIGSMGETQAVFHAREEGGQLLVTLDMQAASGWTLADNCPDLPWHPSRNLDVSGGGWLEIPNFLTQLSFGAVRLVCCNLAHTDAISGKALLPGLSLIGDLSLQGVLFPIGLLLGEYKTLALAGPVREYVAAYDPLRFTGIRLQAPMPLPMDKLGPLHITRCDLLLKSGLNQYQNDPVPGPTQKNGIYILLEAALASRPLQMIGFYDVVEAGYDLSLQGRFTDFAVSGFADLSQTVGVDGLDTLPSELHSPSGLSLTEFGIDLNLATEEINSLNLGIGLPVNWEIIPDVMSLKEIQAAFTVFNPFAASRSINTRLSALLAFKKFNLLAWMSFPGYEIGAALPSGQSLPLGDLLESILPAETDLPPMQVTQLQLQAAPRAKTFSMYARVEEVLSVAVGATAFQIQAVNLAFEYAPGKVTAAVTAAMEMGGASALISGSINNGLTLSGSLNNFDLKKFWSLVTNGDSLPEEVPDVILQSVNFTITPKTGAFSLQGAAQIAWEHLGADQALATTLQFAVSQSVNGSQRSLSANLSLQGTGQVKLADGCSIASFNLQFQYASGAGWSLGGGMGMNLFDTLLDVQAGYEKTADAQKIRLRAMANPVKKLIALNNIGSYAFQQFDLLVDRRLVGDKRQTFFDLRLASRLEIDNLFAIDGYLGLANNADGSAALSFKPNPGTAVVKVDLPGSQGMGVDFSVFEIGFTREAGTGQWGFSGTLNLSFHGFPGFIGKALPTKLNAKLQASSSLVKISALNVTDPISIAFPKARGKSLGKAVVQLNELGLSIKPQAGLMLEAGLGLPAELNTYLGTKLFREYQSGNPLSMARVRLNIGAGSVSMQFLSSPFAGANASTLNGESWFDVDLGQYGALRLKMPSFIYDGTSQYFEAGGGFQITRTLALPLGPLRMFLRAVGGQEMADLFPAKIPLEGLLLVDKDGNLKVDEFISFVKKAGDVPNEVCTVLKKTGKLINRFPDGFKQYFNLRIPEDLEFKFGFSPTGRIAIGMKAGKTPVRVLFPSVVQSCVPMPGLTGIEVRKFTLGSLMSGALLYGEIDATIDQFDLPSLALSLTLPTDPAFPLPTSDQLQRRILLKNVLCMVPVASGLPVPIPLFYDEIGFEYQGIEGLGLQAHVGFPKPALDGSGASAVLQAFSDFTQDSKSLLDPKKAPGGVDIGFVFHDEFLQAPEYLGGKLLGTTGKTIKVGAWKYVASLMNFGKTFSINDCIGSIPLEQRVGSAAYRFAFMSFDADWLLTTPGEFKSGAYKQMKLSSSDVDDFIAVLPTLGSTVQSGAQTGAANQEQGLVTFVRGKTDLGFMKLNAAFGLAASGSMGFNTGFKFDGAIGKIELQLQGAVMVNAPLLSSNQGNTPGGSAGNSAGSAGTGQISVRKLGDRALALNGSNAWIEIPASDSLLLPEYTIELWIKSDPSQIGEWIEVFGIDSLSNRSQRNFYIEINTKGAFYHHRFKDAQGGNSGAPNTPDKSVQWGQWQHLAITNDGKTAKTYVNGKELASGPVNGSLTLLKEPIFIGKVPGSGKEKFWKGEIAEVRIWRRVRDADDIDEYQREVLNGDEPGLVSLYRFDQDSGDMARDLCGRNHGKIVQGKFVASDLLLLDGLEFDNKNSYIEVPDADSLRIPAYTLEAWIKPYVPQEKHWNVMVKRWAKMGLKFNTKAVQASNKPEWGGIVGKAGRNYTMILNRAGYIHHRFHTSKGTNDGAPNTANDAVEWNEWNHIAITNDGKTARTWINGVKMAEGPVEGGKLLLDKGSLIMGRSPDAAGEVFVGQIAEVRLWSQARSEADLQTCAGKRIAPDSPNLVSLWRMSEVEGDVLPDLCGRNPGKLYMQPKRPPATVTNPAQASGVDQGLLALSAKAQQQERAALQVQGHAHLDVLGHRAMVADLRLVDSSFWYRGVLDLFPSDWPLRVYGKVEGMVSKQQFYLSGETVNQLFGLTISKSRLFISNDMMRLEGQWLGMFLKLNVIWMNDDPYFNGSMGFDYSTSIDFGAIRINGVKVSDNVRISLNLSVSIAVAVSKNGFNAQIEAKFQINGKGFNLRFNINVAPSDFNQLVNAIKTEIIGQPTKYLEHLFTDAGTWLKNVANDAIDFAKDSGEAVGAALKSGFNASKETALSLMKANNYAAHQVGAALGKAYGQSAKDCANLLKGAGYAVEDVGAALQKAFNHSAEDATRTLKDIGYGASDVGKALGSAFGKSTDECKSLLKSCGFSSKDIEGAFKSAGKAIENGVKSVGKKLKFW